MSVSSGPPHTLTLGLHLIHLFLKSLLFVASSHTHFVLNLICNSFVKMGDVLRIP